MYFKFSRNLIFQVVTTILFALSQNGKAQCVSLARGAVAFDPKTCEIIQPETYFKKTNPQHKFIFDLDANSQKAFFNTYRGYLLNGKVSMSKVRQKGISDSRGFLLGKDITVFVAPGKAIDCNK